MRPFTLAVCLVIGLTGGWFLMPAPDPGEPSPTEPQATGGDAPDPANSATFDETTVPVGATAVTSEAATVPARGDLAAVLDEFSAGEYPRGSGEISGRVVRESDGTPLAGITIDAIVHGTTPDAEPTGIASEDLLAFVEDEIEQFHYDRAMTRRAVTDADGRFRLEGLSDTAKYHLHVVPDEEWFVTPLTPTRNLSPGSETSYQALPVAFVDLVVVDAAGETLPTAQIELRDPTKDRVFQSAWSPSSPEIRVPLPYTQLAAISPAHHRSPPVDVVVAAGERTNTRLVVAKPPALHVSVRCGDPIDLIGLTVHCVNAEKATSEDPRQWMYDGDRKEVDRTGSVRFEMVPASYRVLLFRGSDVLADQTVDLGSSAREVILTAPPIDRSQTALVEVSAWDGGAVGKVQVQVQSRFLWNNQELGPYQLGSHTEPLGQDRYLVLLEEEYPSWTDGKAKIIEQSISVISDELGSASVPLRLGSGQTHSVIFNEPAFVEVLLLDYVGHPLQGRVSLSLQESDGNTVAQFWRHGGNLDPQGRARLGPVTSGPKTLVITSNDQGTIVERIDLSLAAGENIADVVLPELHSVRIVFPETLAGRHSWLQNLDENNQHAGGSQIEPSGVVTFHDLRPGRYQVHGGTDLDRMTITVPGPAEFRFEPDLVDCLAVSIRNEEGWLARNGFQDGDRVVGIDGLTFRSSRQMQFALMQALATGDCTLDVERGSEQLQLQIPPGQMLVGADLGGSLEPSSRGGGQ